MALTHKQSMTVLLCLALLLLAAAGESIAQNYQIKKSVMASGGDTVAVSPYCIVETFGQPFDEGRTTSTNFVLSSGFLGDMLPVHRPAKHLVPETFTTIIAAMSAAENGDTISVAAGTYPEIIIMKTGVVLISRTDAAETIISRKGVANLITTAPDAVIHGFTISGNDNGEGQAGNGILSDGDNASICYCILSNNSGGIYLTNSSQAKIFNNTIDRNRVGIYMQVFPAPKIYNNIISNNSEAGIYRNTRHSLGEPHFSYNDYFGNAIDFAYYGDPWTPAPGTGDLNADPMFVGGMPFDYHLSGDSPCIDKGDPLGPLDPDGTRADLGALYYQKAHVVNSPEPTEMPAELVLYPAHPNPFNPGTTIEFSQPAAANVTLMIFNIKGEQIRRYTPGIMPAGRHAIHWDGLDQTGRPISSGVYFYRLEIRTENGLFSEVKKMVLTR